MPSIELPYSGIEVTTEEQAKEFLDRVLFPVATMIAGCSFKESVHYQVTREQTISAPNNSSWTEFGFQAIRIVEDNPSLVQFNIWEHVALTTAEIPFSADAEKAAKQLALQRLEDGDGLITRSATGYPLLDQSDSSVGNEADEDSDEDFVIEQRDFYLNTALHKPVRNFDFVYTRNGSAVWFDSQSEHGVELSVTPVEEDGITVIDPEDSFSIGFDVYDLEHIANILGRLGLTAA